MANKEKELYFFTNQYPFGNLETYIENELKFLSTKFTRIFLFPINPSGKARALPNTNIQVITLIEQPIQLKWKILVKHAYHFIKIFYQEYKQESNKPKFLGKINEFKSRLLQCFFIADILKPHLSKDKEMVYYSFWTDEWVTALSILKEKGYINKIISRVHGYDLFKERWPQAIIPFRYFQLKNLDKVFAVSQAGRNYLNQHYPHSKEKFYLNRLNVYDNGNNPWTENTIFTVVSCSNLIPLKRVDKIMEALSLVPFEINWIHFGDGELFHVLTEKLKKAPSNVHSHFKGSTPNEKLIDFYKKNTVNLFIHMSETEGGVPLVLQEAVSFGIPVIAADVGGVNEIVNERTGILVEKEISASNLASVITGFKNSEMNSMAFRNEIKVYWKKYFDAAENYEGFYLKMID